MAEVSVIIPVYNVEKYLAKCLDSVVNQTYKDIEIIAVNDGSTDNSKEILEQYAAKYPKIKIVEQKNAGLSAARNSGFVASSGKYCYFLDSDDWIETNAIELMMNKMAANDVDCVIHSANNVAEDESCVDIARERQGWFDSFAKPEGVYQPALNIPQEVPEVAWNKLYKSEIIKKYECRFPAGLINEDKLFIWTYMLHCRNYYYLNEKLYNYLSRSNSIMGTRSNSPKVLDILDILAEIYKVIEKYKNIDDYKNLLADDYARQVKELFRCMPVEYRKEALGRIKKYYETINNHKKVRKIYWQYKFLWLKEWFEKIFSVKNVKRNNSVVKQIKIFGITIKIKNKKKTKELVEQIEEMQREKCRRMEKIITETKIINNKIVFNNFNGKSYGCNPKYIAEEIIRQKLPYKLVWLVKNVEKNKGDFPKEIELVEWSVENAIREFASAKIWVSNQRMPDLYESGLFKKEEQFYIQTWHGAALKKIEKDVETEKQWWCKWAKVDSQYMDLLLTAGKKEKKIFEHNFYFNGKITDTGLPRDSIFYYDIETKNKIKENVYSKLNISMNKKLILYVPTFRDDKRIDAYNLEIDKVLASMKERFNEDFAMLVRLHPNVSKQSNEIFKYDENIVNATSYPDVQELMVSSEVLITDYSSCMFDFMLTDNPIFLFMSDIEKYKKERNFYIDFENLPFSIAKSNGELFDNIENFTYDIYLNKLNNFIKQYGYREQVDIKDLINYINNVVEKD